MSRRPKFAARNAAAPTTVSVWLLALPILTSASAPGAGCYSPDIGSGNLTCAAQTCPRDFYCATDGKCWRNGEGPPPVVDSGDPDMAAVDGGVDGRPAPVPVLVQAASASPTPVTSVSTVLSVQADDPGGEGGGLVYSWSATGPGQVLYSVNNSPLANQTTAAFTHAGVYMFTVSIRTVQGGMISSMVEVEVQPKLNDLAVMPPMATVSLNGMAQFMAMGFDQFGDPFILTTQPSWALVGGCGSVNQNGLVQAGMTVASACTLFATVGTITSAATVSVGTAQPAVVTPIADTYVEDGKPDMAFGGATVLHVKTQTDSGNTRIAYLKFNLTGAMLPLSSVKLRLFGRATGSTHTHGVYAVNDTGWNETMVTWRNRPALGMRRAMVGVTTAPKYHEWDLTAHVRERLTAGDMLLTLAVSMEGSVTDAPDYFDSREATNKPQLVLTP